MKSSLPPAGSKYDEQQNNRLMLQCTQHHWSPCYYLQDTINSSRQCHRPPPPSKKKNNSSTVLGVQHHLHIASFTLPVHLSQFPVLRQLAACLIKKAKVSSPTYPYRICNGNITSGFGFIQVLQFSPVGCSVLTH